MKVITALLVLSVIGLSSAQFGFGSLTSLLPTAKPKAVSNTVAAAAAQAKAAADAAAAAKAKAEAEIAAAKAKAEAELAASKAKAAAAAQQAKENANAAAQQAKEKLSEAAADVQIRMEKAKEDVKEEAGKIKEKLGAASEYIKSGASAAKEQLMGKYHQLHESSKFQEAQKKWDSLSESAKKQLKDQLAKHPEIEAKLKEAERVAQQTLSSLKGKVGDKLPVIKEKASELKNQLNRKFKEWNIHLPF